MHNSSHSLSPPGHPLINDKMAVKAKRILNSKERLPFKMSDAAIEHLCGFLLARRRVKPKSYGKTKVFFSRSMISKNANTWHCSLNNMNWYEYNKKIHILANNIRLNLRYAFHVNLWRHAFRIWHPIQFFFNKIQILFLSMFIFIINILNKFWPIYICFSCLWFYINTQKKCSKNHNND